MRCLLAYLTPRGLPAFFLPWGLSALVLLGACSESPAPPVAPPTSPPVTVATLAPFQWDSSGPTRARWARTNRPVTLTGAGAPTGRLRAASAALALHEIGVVRPGGGGQAATHVTFHPRFALPADGRPVVPVVYVTSQGRPGQPGQIDILDVANASAPFLRGTLTPEGPMQFFAAHVDRDTLFLAGMLETPLVVPPACGTCDLVRLRAGAIVLAVELDPVTGLPVRGPRLRNVAGHVATDIQAIGSRVYVTSGQQGGLTILERASLAPVAFHALLNPRSLWVRPQSADGGLGYVMVQDGGVLGGLRQVHLFSLEGTRAIAGSPVAGFPGDADPDYKGTMVADDANRLVYLAMGRAGVGVYYEHEGGSSLGVIPMMQGYFLPVFNPQGRPVADVVSQSVRPYGQFLLVANGGAGVAVYQIDTTGARPVLYGQPVPAFRPLGTLSFDDVPYSVNFIHGGPGVMYLATGLGGLRIVAGRLLDEGPTGPALQVTVEGDSLLGTFPVDGYLPVRPAVRVRNRLGQPIAGVSVQFALVDGFGGQLEGTPALTGADGVARLTNWRLGTAVGTYRVRALVPSAGITDPSTAPTFVVIGAAGRATEVQVAATSAQTQAAVASASVGTVPVVRVIDAFGNGVAGITVTFAVSPGNGVLPGGLTTYVATTDGLGFASVGTWTIGSGSGIRILTAAMTGSGISGNPMTFTAIVP